MVWNGVWFFVVDVFLWFVLWCLNVRCVINVVVEKVIVC